MLNVDFYHSTSCRYCQSMGINLSRLHNQGLIRLSVIEYNRDIHKDVTYTPTVVVTALGKELGRLTSMMSYKVTRDWFLELEEYKNKYLGETKNDEA